MMNLQLLLCSKVILLLIMHTAFASNHYYGNDFYLGVLKNNGDATTRLWLSVSTNSTDGNVLFTTYSLYFTTIRNVSIDKPVSIDLPLELVVRDYSYEHRGKGIHVFTHDANEFISVVLYNWEAGSVGDYISIPCNPYSLPETVGNSSPQFIYYSVSTSSDKDNLLSQTLLVGCQNNTIINVFPTQELSLPISIGAPYSHKLELKPKQHHSFMLNAGETLFLGNAKNDISGTKIVSDKPLTVISGHECGNIPSGANYCEHITVQIPPTHTWGTEFILIPFKSRESGQYFKVMAKHASTEMSIFCNETLMELIFVQQEGGFDSFFIDSESFCYLASDKPILLVQFALGGELDNIGDPIMIIIPPIQQYIHTVYLDVLKRDDFMMSFVNIATADRYNDILYDGLPLNDPTLNWTTIYDNDSNIIGYGCMMAVNPGAHTITHTTNVMSVIQYGFNVFENRGYGHVLGSQLNLLNEKLFVTFDQKHFSVVENHTSVVVGVHCKASFTANSTVLVKTIPSDIEDLTILDHVIYCQQGESTYQNITILINDDNLVEQQEEFVMYLEAISEEFISDINRTIITIIDNDFPSLVEVGFVQNLELISNEEMRIKIGVMNDIPHQENIVIIINTHIIINDTVYVYDAILTDHVPTLQIDFNFTRILNHKPVDMDCSIVVVLSTINNNVFIKDNSQTIVLQSTILSSALFSSNYDKSLVISTTIAGEISLCTTAINQQPFNTVSFTIIIISAIMTIIIIIIIIIVIITSIIIVKKTNKQVPGIVNPCISKNS